MKLISWNINGIRAAIKKGFEKTFKELDADIFAIQETKCQVGQVELNFDGYESFWSAAEKKGYSGTAVWSKNPPIQVLHGLDLKGKAVLDMEGRLTALEFNDFWFVCVYTPNAQHELKRIDFRLEWDAAFREFSKELEAGKRGSGKKPVIMCGDFNVAHEEIDLKYPGPNRGNAGFSDEERESFTKLLDAGFTDTFRHLFPEKHECYSWWSYRANARAQNIGWRIDYFLTSDSLVEQLKTAKIHAQIMGSDHCPVELQIK
ncbi:MAG: exodeoxyribonuclease III [Eggerthellaceae bacterium]|nr:exodeoxyribonuclease III [Eggerthellaceae bacterium]